MYGTQTMLETIINLIKFENDVKMYGTQTVNVCVHATFRLRMM